METKRVKVTGRPIHDESEQTAIPPKKIWDNYIEVARVQKSDRLCFVIAAGTRDGFRCISVREFYYVKRDNAWKPGRDGIIIPLVMPLGRTRKPDPKNPPTFIKPYVELLKALEQASDVATDMALKDPENEIWTAPR